MDFRNPMPVLAMKIGIEKQSLSLGDFVFGFRDGSLHAFEFLLFFEAQFSGLRSFWRLRLGWFGPRSNQRGTLRPRLFLQVIIVVTFAVGDAPVSFEGKDGCANAVQEIAVVTD